MLKTNALLYTFLGPVLVHHATLYQVLIQIATSLIRNACEQIVLIMFITIYLPDENFQWLKESFI